MLLVLKRFYRFFKFYRGPFFSWDSAINKSMGYDNDKILNHIYLSAKKAKKKGLIEKDGFLKKNFEINSILTKIINKHKKNLNILDFGGGFGTLYFQYKKLNQNFNWFIIEQKKVCNLASSFLNNEKKLSYHSDFQFLKNKKIDIVILSSSIQYVKDYRSILKKIKNLKPSYIIFLKTPLNRWLLNFLFVQKIPQNVYEGSYPSWIFTIKSLNKILFPNYKLKHKKKVEPKLFFSDHFDLFYKIVS